MDLNKIEQLKLSQEHIEVPEQNSDSSLDMSSVELNIDFAETYDYTSHILSWFNLNKKEN